MTPEERFLKLVNKTDTCWLWKGCKFRKGYGRVVVNRKNIGAHRHAYSLFVGPIPVGICVLHSCDVPACVNPAHLRLGTNQENVNDKMSRGRFKTMRGVLNGMAKVTEETVRLIRKDVGTMHELGDKYGISWQQIYCIKARTNWAHVA